MDSPRNTTLHSICSNTGSKGKKALTNKRKLDYENDGTDFNLGMAVFVPCAEECWQPGVIAGSTQDRHLVVKLQTNKEVEVSQADVLLRSDDQDLSLAADLTHLTPLSMATVLHCLRERYHGNQFYTGAGSTVVAVNPFTDCRRLYGRDVMARYRARPADVCEPGDPHVYRTAEAAFSQMATGIGQINQSIIVSGESGSGKTVSARHLMNYLVSAPALSTPTYQQSALGVGSSIEKQILGSNPILEAFGNASTLRNYNSSRFGRYIQLHFNKCLEVVGARIHTYLLEKTRVVHQASGEASFHIFYQLLSGCKDPDVRGWLDLPTPPSSDDPTPTFFYTNNTYRDTGEDIRDWAAVQEALTDIQLTSHSRQHLLQLLCAILHLGNVILVSDPEDEDVCHVSPDDKASQYSLHMAARLLCVGEDTLESIFSHRRITAMHRRRQSVFHKPCSVEEAMSRRNCLAKLIYAELFEWLVSYINLHLDISGNASACTSISILDIYGFESFTDNSLEQLCINYANEKLQQHYVRHFLKDLQEDYAHEAIPWTFTEFQDNQPCLDLLEGNPGVLSILDEECQLNRPSNSDALCERLLTTLSGNVHLLRAKRARSVGPGFVVNHYAGSVHYSVTGLVEKNKDNVPAELVELLQQSSHPLIAELFAVPQNDAPGKKQKSVLSKFKASLDELLTCIEDTHPHYIRCIKPNPSCQAKLFDAPYVMDQLLAAGLLETVQISRHAYPARVPYDEFLRKYGLVLLPGPTPPCMSLDPDSYGDHKDADKENELLFEPLDKLYQKQLQLTPKRCSTTPRRRLRRRACQSSADHTRKLTASILKLVFGLQYTDGPTTCAQFGRSKVFLRNGQLEKLEKVRLRLLGSYVFSIQCAWRRLQRWKRAQKYAQAILTLQAAVRGWRVRHHLARQTAAVQVLQKALRAHIQRKLHIVRAATARQLMLTVCSPQGSSPPHTQPASTASSTKPHRHVAFMDPVCKTPEMQKYSNSDFQTPSELYRTPATQPRSDTHDCFYTPLCTPMMASDGSSTPKSHHLHISSHLYSTPTNAGTSPPGESDSLLLSCEHTPEGVMYHVSHSPAPGTPGTSSQSDVCRVVAAAISASFLSESRFHLCGAFQGIPYFEAHSGVLSRRRLPRVQVKFHTRPNPLLKYGHYVHHRELVCSLSDCLLLKD